MKDCKSRAKNCENKGERRLKSSFFNNNAHIMHCVASHHITWRKQKQASKGLWIQEILHLCTTDYDTMVSDATEISFVVIQYFG